MGKFEILTLEQLLARLEKYKHYKIFQVHHTYEPNHADFNGKNHIQLQEAMRNYHVNTRGWKDIGQHVTLFPDGLFVTGRDFSLDPAGIEGMNRNAFMMEMLGNFDKGHDVLKGPQKDAALGLTKYFLDRGVEIVFHREYAPKTCPGTGIDKASFIAEAKIWGMSKVNEQWEKEKKEAQEWVKRNGISDGTRPTDPVTREELWAMLKRYHEKKEGIK